LVVIFDAFHEVFDLLRNAACVLKVQLLQLRSVIPPDAKMMRTVKRPFDGCMKNL
jgi:hypothetical protein